MDKKQQPSADEPIRKVTGTAHKPPVQSHRKSIPVEVGGPKGPEPTRFGDWERNGRCSDF